MPEFWTMKVYKFFWTLKDVVLPFFSDYEEYRYIDFINYEFWVRKSRCLHLLFCPSILRVFCIKTAFLGGFFFFSEDEPRLEDKFLTPDGRDAKADLDPEKNMTVLAIRQKFFSFGICTQL